MLTLVLLAISVYWAFTKNLLGEKYIRYIFILSAVYGLIHLLFFILNRNLNTRSTIIAILYNGRVLAYLFIGYIIARAYDEDLLRKAIKIILIASTITCVFALIQYIAPKDIMTHFGYSIERGAKPSFFIDDKPDFPRVMSTIRDPNSFGSYLILPLSILWLSLFRPGTRKHRLKMGALVLLHSLAILLTFSRGAWLGTFVALSLLSVKLHYEKIRKFFTRSLPILICIVAVAITSIFFIRHQYIFQNIFLHSDQKTVLADPNELRLELQARTTKAAITHPSGHGPGTAGLASIGNPNGTFLTENYYLQIAYEVGILGLICFMGITIITYRQLILSKTSSLRSSLIASFWAYILISFLIHLWSNEAVAAQWWLLAGIVCAKTKPQVLLK